jgi:hypothetical protein
MRLTRKFTDVVNEVRLILASEFNITQKQLTAFRERVDGNGHTFPEGSHFVPFSNQWLDYEVQRAAIPKHILQIMKEFDPRLCGPASACRVEGSPEIVDPTISTIYDGQQRSLAMALLGYSEGPCNVVITTDPAFPSYAFEMLNETGVKKLTPGDLHRNALTRWRLGSKDIRNQKARTLQDQFDAIGIDLQDKGARKSATQRGENEYFFSHFKYAYKGIELDKKGRILFQILDAIVYAFPKQEEIDQGVYIGLYELARLDENQDLPDGWMRKVLKTVAMVFPSSDLVHAKAKLQWAHVNPGATWSAPSAMSNFLREVYMLAGGKIVLPYHGEGAKMQVSTNAVRGLIPRAVAAKRRAVQ